MPTTTRQCPACGRNRAARFFTARAKDCVSCQKARRRATARALHLLKTYGMTDDHRRALIAHQGDGCAICGGARDYNLPLDHDHSLPDGIESWRGFLCKRCNKLLRDVRDNPLILEAAADYLRDPPARKVFAQCSTSSDT